MSKLQKWQILNSKMVLNHQWCQVRQDEVKLPSGAIIDDYFVNIKPDIVLVFPITANREVIFVRQYRHGAENFFIELPAGRFDPKQESAEDAGLRELQEETGYTAKQLIKIGTLYDNPSKETNQIHFFLAENVIKVGEQNLDITEEIEVILIPVDSILEKITQGEISVAGTVAALFLGLKFVADK
ncbi:NUDIX hydrolase [Nostoc sp. NIES-3756]|jgi:8-oxo-dGTP pyrophosphatase MutT (NUDIX family)|uniref:NUDIX hydrolase n=1 Tax=Nostoc sp. NIES-3756 TaxID=1751286 RepID=UPI000722F6C8|nr:NUDIX hydrolase [Nostoc sp. NIES-3756]BAT55230.1 NUDIX hydrolase [Nostoc sp. NIES-3756]BAY36989.1 NUDIX hydrolase [Nostoc sp. NIES-2111]